MTETTPRVRLEPYPHRVRGIVDGVTIVDSTNVRSLLETGHQPVYYFPREDVRFDLLRPTDLHTVCPFKGQASYWSITTPERTVENAVWGYPDPIDDVPEIAGLVAFYADTLEWIDDSA